MYIFTNEPDKYAYKREEEEEDDDEKERQLNLEKFMGLNVLDMFKNNPSLVRICSFC